MTTPKKPNISSKDIIAQIRANAPALYKKSLEGKKIYEEGEGVIMPCDDGAFDSFVDVPPTVKKVEKRDEGK